MKTAWCRRRLQELFARYNRKFWTGRLKTIPVCVGACLGKAMGYWENRNRIIVDIVFTRVIEKSEARFYMRCATMAPVSEVMATSSLARLSTS